MRSYKIKLWELVPPSSHFNLLGSKWVLKTKYRADGSLERRKASLVAKGFCQQSGLDYTETFSLVIKLVTIRTVLSLAVTRKWPLHQLDIHNAFLHGDLEDDVYIRQPPGFVNPDFPTYVCKLKKSLYGLKQAPRGWFAKLSDQLFSLGFISSVSDSSLFILRTVSSTIYVLVYVDDIIVTCFDVSLIPDFISSLNSHFPVKDLGALNFFLSIQLTRTPSGLFLSQSKYISYMLQCTNMHNSKPVTTPMSILDQLTILGGCAFDDPQLYCSVVGSLQYLVFSRPDISFAINKVY